MQVKSTIEQKEKIKLDLIEKERMIMVLERKIELEKEVQAAFAHKVTTDLVESLLAAFLSPFSTPHLLCSIALPPTSLLSAFLRSPLSFPPLLSPLLSLPLFPRRTS